MADYNVNPGDLRQQITFQEPTIAKDAGGAQSSGYANVSTNPTVWSRWIYDHGDESVSSGAEKSAQRATVTVRHRTDILETWQILKDAEVWKIISKEPVQERNRWVEMRVERVKGTA